MATELEIDTSSQSATLLRRRRRVVRLKIAVAAVLAVACGSTLLAQRVDNAAGEPTSRPWRGGGFGGMDGGIGRRPLGEDWRNAPVPSADEWDEVVNFMQENSPVRLQMYQKLETEKGADSNVATGVRKRTFARYRDLKAMADRKSDMYEFAFKQLKVEDNVLDVLAQIRRDGESPALVEQRSKQIHEFVTNALDERQARLDKLRDFIKREEANLANDRANMPALEDRQRERFDKEMKRLLDFAVDGDASTKPQNK